MTQWWFSKENFKWVFTRIFLVLTLILCFSASPVFGTSSNIFVDQDIEFWSTTSTLTYWQTYTFPSNFGAEAVLEQSTSSYHGDYSVFMKQGTDGGTAVLGQNFLGLNEGDTFKIWAWVKSDDIEILNNHLACVFTDLDLLNATKIYNYATGEYETWNPQNDPPCEECLQYFSCENNSGLKITNNYSLCSCGVGLVTTSSEPGWGIGAYISPNMDMGGSEDSVIIDYIELLPHLDLPVDPNAPPQSAVFVTSTEVFDYFLNEYFVPIGIIGGLVLFLGIVYIIFEFVRAWRIWYNRL